MRIMGMIDKMSFLSKSCFPSLGAKTYFEKLIASSSNQISLEHCRREFYKRPSFDGSYHTSHHESFAIFKSN